MPVEYSREDYSPQEKWNWADSLAGLLAVGLANALMAIDWSVAKLINILHPKEKPISTHES